MKQDMLTVTTDLSYLTLWRWVDGELESCISKDELLTDISLF